MRILWLSHLIPYPPKGGVLQRSHYLLRELAGRHEVDLLAFNQERLIAPLFDSVADGVAESEKALGAFCNRLRFFHIPAERRVHGRRLLALRSLIHQPYTINWLKSKEFSAVIKQWVSEGQYDLVHFDTISLIPFFDCIPSAVPKVLDHHNIESHMLLRRARREKSLIKKTYFWQEGVRLRRYEARFCPRFTLNITCSDVDSQRLQSIAPAVRALAIPNGVDMDFFRPAGHPIDQNRLIFVGSMSWYPNIEAVLYIADQLWPQLKQMHPALEFHVVGANPPEIIRSRAQRLSGFHVHGFVDDVRPFMEAAAVYVCPIQDGGGTKLKILDAMAMQKAVVAHPLACEGINVTHGENVLLADTPTMFLEQIDVLLRDPEKGRKLGIAARKLMSEEYDYRAIGRKLSETYQSLEKSSIAASLQKVQTLTYE